jgi:phosphoribosylglycinamide formyltransferase-1
VSRKRTAILISGRGSNMRALIAAARADNFPAEIALALSNAPNAGGLDFARSEGIAAEVVDHKAFAGREAFERALQAKLEAHGVELICLAGFMRLLSTWFVETWRERMLNVHPALLPSYRGLHTHERALADGVKIHGATVHFVVPEMDAGPIVAQAAVAVRADDTPETLGARVLEQEHIIYPQALALVASGAAKVENGRVMFAAEPAPASALRSPHSI